MKYLLVLFLVGLASAASLYDVSHDIDDETVEELLVASHFADVLHSYDFELADEGEDDKGSEIIQKLKDRVEKLLEKIREAIEKGKDMKEDWEDKVKELKEKLKELKGRFSEKAKELLQKIRELAKDKLKKLLEKLGLKEQEKRFISLKDIFKKLKEAILSKLDGEALKQKIEELFGKGSDLADLLLQKLKEHGKKGKEKILDFIDRILGGDDESPEKRSVSELWQKVKDFFKKIKVDISEKYLKFGEWVKEKLADLIEKAKTKREALKEIAQQLIDHAKDVSREIFDEGVEFLRPYKEDLGALWDQMKKAGKDVFGETY